MSHLPPESNSTPLVRSVAARDGSTKLMCLLKNQTRWGGATLRFVDEKPEILWKDIETNRSWSYESCRVLSLGAFHA